MTFRKKLYQQLHQKAFAESGLSPLNRAVFLFIIFSVVVVIIETEKPLYWKYHSLFITIDYIIGFLFTLEYVCRVWTAGVNPRYSGIKGCIRYMLTPAALVDLLVIIPFFVMSNSNIFVARCVRLFRLFAIAKFGRYSQAVILVHEAVWSRRHELALSFMLTAILLLVTSTIMWAVEGDEQFDSIPRALWWGVITLTTVGYGDVYPRTVLGKICSGVTALAGIGLIAMPAGILAAAFSDAFQKHKQTLMKARQEITGANEESGGLQRKRAEAAASGANEESGGLQRKRAEAAASGANEESGGLQRKRAEAAASGANEESGGLQRKRAEAAASGANEESGGLQRKRAEAAASGANEESGGLQRKRAEAAASGANEESGGLQRKRAEAAASGANEESGGLQRKRAEAAASGANEESGGLQRKRAEAESGSPTAAYEQTGEKKLEQEDIGNHTEGD